MTPDEARRDRGGGNATRQINAMLTRSFPRTVCWWSRFTRRRQLVQLPLTSTTCTIRRMRGPGGNLLLPREPAGGLCDSARLQGDRKLDETTPRAMATWSWSQKATTPCGRTRLRRVLPEFPGRFGALNGRLDDPITPGSIGMEKQRPRYRWFESR